MEEVWNLSLTIDRFATIADRLGHGAGSTGEHTNFAHITVLLLDKLEEAGHVRSAKVVDGLEAGEHAAPAQPLEVILTDVQHSGTQVKLVEELSNEDVHLQHICHILLLHVAQYINEPLKVPVWWTNPQEVHLLASNSWVSVGRRAKDQIVKDRRVWRNTDTTANHNRHLELVPILIASAEWTLNLDLGRVVFVLLLVVDAFVKTVS